MRTAVYSPYLDTASGGERYMLTIASILKEFGEVDVLLDNHLFSIGAEKIKKLNEQRHDIDLNNVNFLKAPVGIGSKILERNKFLKKYDLLFYLSDGSIFYSTAGRSFVHIQMPLDVMQIGGLVNYAKWTSWKKIIFNSDFTKKEISKKLKKSSVVIYPPVNIQRFSKKEGVRKNYILNVGRFVGDGVKKQHVLINAFVQMKQKYGLKGWQLHLAGALRDEDRKYFEELVGLAAGEDIVFHPNITFDELTQLYLQSKIYWHGMGYEEEDPKKMEHFGITTVEAMGAGLVPVVVNKGGQREIVSEGEDGFLWDDLDALIKKTDRLIKDESLRKNIVKKSVIKSQQFSEDNFKDGILNLLR